MVLATNDPTVRCDITGLQAAPSAVAWSDSSGDLICLCYGFFIHFRGVWVNDLSVCDLMCCV